ncbi:hypothetical protein [Actinocrispum sp. NPDC049592]|uniref:hypothetical protein n=1 Tax=Actinocrispum sp. NPDC049592 TaxID=3154835 RepID=UPI00344A022C
MIGEPMARNPLPLLARAARVVTWLVGLTVLVVVVANVSALGWLPGTHVTPACVDVGGQNVCRENPTVMQRFANMGDQVPAALFALGALVLLLRFLRTAANEGPYAGAVPGQLSALGWFVLVGAPVSALLFAVSQEWLRTSLTGTSGRGWFTVWTGVFPWWSTAAGVAALTFAYILRIGVRMNEDLEGTI